MIFVKPKKFLRQHFLKDDNIASKIVDSIGTQAVNVIEIGAGMGVLTKFLLQKTLNRFYIIEIDKESVEFLRVHFPEMAEHIIHADFLHYDLTDILSENYTIIGNFPYNISSQILFRILEYRNQVNEVIGMFQNEVALRISAQPGSKSYGILSVLLQAYYHIEYLFKVNESVFFPPPKVKSAVIRLKRNNIASLDCDEKLFKQIIKTAFNQRRKKIRNALKSIVSDKEFTATALFDKRAEQLNVQDYIYITRYVEKI